MATVIDDDDVDPEVPPEVIPVPVLPEKEGMPRLRELYMYAKVLFDLS